jgi:hypothetical protein
MKKVVWTGLLVALCVAASGIGISAAGPLDQPRRQVRAERIERIRERIQQRRAVVRERLGEQRFQQRERLRERRIERMDRNRDGRISRAERVRERIAVRRALRRAHR